MTIAPFTDDQEMQRRTFRGCVLLRMACRRRAYAADALDGDVADYGWP